MTKILPSPEDLLSPKELAAHARWPVRRVRNLISANQIRHIRIGGNIFSPRNAIEEYVKANMVEPDTLPHRGLDTDQLKVTAIKCHQKPANDSFAQASKFADILAKKKRT